MKRIKVRNVSWSLDDLNRFISAMNAATPEQQADAMTKCTPEQEEFARRFEDAGEVKP